MTVPEVFTLNEMAPAAWPLCSTWTADDWERASSRIDRNDNPALLVSLACRLPAAVLPVAVPGAWSSAEFPQQLLAADDWRYLWERAGYTVDGVPAARPSEPVRLWRGSTHKYRRRWSWTDNRDRAQWFADRFNLLGRDEGTVWTMLAPPERLLAYIHTSSRGESEYVVDTRGLPITPAEA